MPNFLRYLALFAVSSFFAPAVVSAADFPFSDVPENDPIYQDLKNLYQRGVIDTPGDGKFHPEALMDRDEFVSIAVWVSCRRCLTPTLDDILKYRELPFLDFERTSPYFYCVSYAKDVGMVRGYSIEWSTSYACQDEKRWEGVPFCAKNRTSRIEAVAVLLRQAGLWSESSNSLPFAKNIVIKDVSDYWYGYAQKGIESKILSIDSESKVKPDEYLTKREFVKMAGTIFSFNMCEMKGMGKPSDSSNDGFVGSDKIPSELRVLDPAAACYSAAPISKMEDPNAEKYNFYGQPDIDGAKYVWEFVKADGTGTGVTAEGKCLPNFNLSPGLWVAKLTVTDPKGNTSVSKAAVPFGPSTTVPASLPLSVNVTADPLTAPVKAPIDFTSVVSGGKGPYTFEWEFADGSISNLEKPTHPYSGPGVYPVVLKVTDSEGKVAEAKVVVKIVDTGTDAFASEIKVFDTPQKCSPTAPVSKMEDPNATKYNLYGQPDIEGVKYVWEFVKADGTGTGVTAEGKCLSDFSLPAGLWVAKLTVINPEGKTSTSIATVPYGPSPGSKIPLSVHANADPLVSPAGTIVDFSSVVSGGNGPYVYRWDYGDGSFSTDSDPKHPFNEAGTYPVTLIVTDADGNRAVAKVVVTATVDPDLDDDGVLNKEDACPNVSGPRSNSGCPKLTEYGKTPVVAIWASPLTLSPDGIGNKCLFNQASPVGAIFGKSSCDSCPCPTDLDFTAQVRKCDLLLPSILSKDKKTIFSRGALYELK